MDQVLVEKRGSWNTHHWSQRVLSLSPHLGVATLSQREHVEDCHCRCMHVIGVQMWPHFGKKHIHGNFNAMEAKLTLRVKGFAVRLGERVVHRADGPQHVLRYTQRNCGCDGRTWMLRFATFAELEKTVHLFQSITSHVHVKASTEGSQATENDCHALREKKEEASTAAAVEESDAGVVVSGASAAAASAAACANQHRGDAPLSDDLDAAGVTPSSVMEGDVASDLELIRCQWEQTHRPSAASVA